MKGIYKIINESTGKYYLGSTNDFDKRWKYHLRYLRKNKHWNKHLQHSYNLYGEDCFSFKKQEIMSDSTTETELLNKEQEYLDDIFKSKNNSCYNICKGAGKPPSRKGCTYKMSDEHKYKLSLQRGWKHNKKARDKMSKHRKNKSWEEIYGVDGANNKREIASKTCKKYLSQINKGVKLTSKHKDKISKSLKGRKISEKCKRVNSERCSKPIYQLDKETGKTLKEYKSALSAEINLIGKRGGGISAVCKGKQKTAYGFKWKYKEI